MKRVKVLFVGESWHVHVTESKGFDVFSYDYYEQATEYIQAALEACGCEFCHIPAHMVESDFPGEPEALAEYGAVMFSDVGANTFNLPMNVFQRLHPTPNRLEAVRSYVCAGGSFAMIGGYLSFQGIQGRGCYRNSALAEVLPVELLPGDDRVESSAGVTPTVALSEHPIIRGLPQNWPQVLGYNRLIAKRGTETVARIGEDPLIVTSRFGKGRVLAYATDCAPHWSQVEFCTWDGYKTLWANIMEWLLARE